MATDAFHGTTPERDRQSGGRACAVLDSARRAMAAETTTGRGRLYLVATPIGNLEDITLRALRVLGEADVVACEDTRQTRKLFDRHGIDRPLVSYHEHNELMRAPQLCAIR